MQRLVFNIQIGNSNVRSCCLWCPHIIAPLTFWVHFFFFLEGLNSSQFQRKEARNGGSSKGAAGKEKELDQRLRIAGSSAKGEKGRGNGWARARGRSSLTGRGSEGGCVAVA